jgi:hypothetical protein
MLREEVLPSVVLTRRDATQKIKKLLLEPANVFDKMRHRENP